MTTTSLTQNFIDKAQCPSDKSKIDYFDTKQTGLLLKVLKSESKSFYIRFKNLDNKMKEKKIGCAKTISLTQARQLAKDLLSQITLGIDPFEQKKKEASVITFKQFVNDHYIPHIKGYKASSGTDLSLLKNHILPALSNLKLNQIKRLDVVSLFSKHRETHKPGSTNRIIILCRYIFNCALKWQIEGIDKNPTEGIPLYPENNKIERYLSTQDAQRLFAALEQSQAKMLKPIITMLLLTGARRNEVLQAKWSDFDFVKRSWRIEKNKSGKTRHVPLNDGAVALLHSMERFDGCEYAFPNPDTLKPYTHIFQSWDTVRKKAGLPDFRIHDLRHSFASFLVNNGRSLYEVQKILGHTQIKTTQRYAHLANDTLVDASNAAFNAISISHFNQAQAVPLVAIQ